MSAAANRGASMTPRGKTYGPTGSTAGGRERGQNVNHLLSFTLPPRARPPAPTTRRSKRTGASQPFNKERYVAAQYRFLVKPTGDYTAYFADADIYLNWPDILTVLIPTSSALAGASTSALSASSQPSLETHEGAACPICLSPPTAPRMTKCGHVYCYPCILQYLSSSDTANPATPHRPPGSSAAPVVQPTTPAVGPSSRQWKRCPICWDAVYAKDLKAVKWWDPKSIARSRATVEGHCDAPIDAQDVLETSAPADWLRMRLIERPQITTLALPQSSTWPTSSTSPSDQPLIAQHQAPWHFQPDVAVFAKFMLATPESLLSSLTQDMDELADERKLLGSLGPSNGDSAIQFVDLAERKVREQMAKVVGELDTPAVQSAIGFAKNELKEHYQAERSRKVRDDEHISRRRRRMAEKEQAAETEPTAAAPTQRPGSHGDDERRKTEELAVQAESTVGSEAFLALKALGQGGAYSMPTGPEAQKREGDPPSTRTEDVDDRPGRPTKLPPKSRRNLNPPNPSASSYLFYQASSGQNIFMHPLDIKIMHSHFGSYSKFPRDIAVKVQSAEEGSMNEELRKRCKYLTHLPRGTDVVFIEIDWELMANDARHAPSAAEGSSQHPPERPLVSKQSLKQYEPILKARRNKRRDRDRRDDRAKLKAEEAEAASRPGGAAMMALHRQKQQHPGRGTTDDHVYGRSPESNPHGVGPHAFSGESDVMERPGSPSFMESAMWGAEREFPIHPGGAMSEQDKDFPSVAGIGDRSPLLMPQGNAPSSKTVWGTPSARPSFSNAVHASSRRSHQGNSGWDDEADEAWLELEEGFVLGTNTAKQVRPGRGLNSQSRSQSYSAAGQSRTAGGSTSASSQPQSGANSDSTVGPASNENGSSGGAKGRKQRKAKLVLTSGGRGTA